MFSENKKSLGTFSQQNTISKGTVIVGDISSNGDFRIEGNIEGNINTSGKVVVGKTGFINGSLSCENADFEGKLSGTLSVLDTLSLRASAIIEGEVEVGKLAVEPGAAFNANCSMKGTVKDLINEQTPISKTDTKAEQTA